MIFLVNLVYAEFSMKTKCDVNPDLCNALFVGPGVELSRGAYGLQSLILRVLRPSKLILPFHSADYVDTTRQIRRK